MKFILARSLLSLSLLIGLSGFTAGGEEEFLRLFVGRVSALSDHSIEVSEGGRRLRVTHGPGTSEIPEGISVGDRVSIWYSVEPRELRFIHKSWPQKTPEDDLLIDDRAFYDAHGEPWHRRCTASSRRTNTP